MSKKLLTILTIVILLVVVIGGGAFIYVFTKNTSPEGETPSVLQTLKQINPFGESDPLGIGKVIDKVVPDNIFNSNETTSTEQKKIQQVLFKLSNERTGGVAFADVLIPKTIEVRKRITIDDPLAASSSKPRKISVLATTTEIVFATSSRIRFVEQATGHIYEYDYASSTSRKLTNTTIPKIQEAYFLDRGSKVLLRYLDSSYKNIENYLAVIPVSSVTDSLTGNFLPNNISDISVSPTTNEFFYLAKTSSGSIGNIYNTKTSAERRVFSSSFSEWLPDWKSNSVYLTTKPHSSFAGFLYSQSLVKNTLTRVTGSIFGLTSLGNRNGSHILLGNGYNISILDTKTGASLPVAGLYTLPEKCVWNDDLLIVCFGQENLPEGRFPEVWYQGKFSFNDSIFLLDANTGYYTKLAVPSELYGGTVFIDAHKLQVSDDGSVITFINKIDMTPWYLNIKELLTYIQNVE